MILHISLVSLLVEQDLLLFETRKVMPSIGENKELHRISQTNLGIFILSSTVRGKSLHTQAKMT